MKKSSTNIWIFWIPNLILFKGFYRSDGFEWSQGAQVFTSSTRDCTVVSLFVCQLVVSPCPSVQFMARIATSSHSLPSQY